MSKTLTRVYISAGDYEEAKDFIEAAAKHDVGFLEYKALLLSAIVCYGRPFSRNEISPDPPSDPKLTGVDPQAVLGADFALHEKIVRARNKAAAHSEAELNPVTRIPMFAGKRGSLGITFAARRWHPATENIDLEAFGRIATAMMWACRNILIDVARAEQERKPP